MSKRDYLFQKGGKDRRGRRESFFLLLLGEPRRGSRHNSELEEGKGLGCLGKGEESRQERKEQREFSRYFMALEEGEGVGEELEEEEDGRGRGRH